MNRLISEGKAKIHIERFSDDQLRAFNENQDRFRKLADQISAEQNHYSHLVVPLGDLRPISESLKGEYLPF